MNAKKSKRRKGKERSYTYEQFKRKFMPECPEHCFCRTGFLEQRPKRICCHCGEREP